MIIILNHQHLQFVVLKSHHYENYQKQGVLNRHRKGKISTKKNSKCKPQSNFKKMTEARAEKVKTEDNHFCVCLPKSSDAWLRDHRKNTLTGNSSTYCESRLWYSSLGQSPSYFHSPCWSSKSISLTKI